MEFFLSFEGPFQIIMGFPLFFDLAIWSNIAFIFPTLRSFRSSCKEHSLLRSSKRAMLTGLFFKLKMVDILRLPKKKINWISDKKDELSQPKLISVEFEIFI